jgi:hypothetical protein
MNRYSVKTLVLGDSDIECKTNDITKMNIGNTNFIQADLDKYDLVVYQGKLGTKILKSRYFSIGQVVK